MKEKMIPIRDNCMYFGKWAVFSLLIGLVVGAAGSVFSYAVVYATRFWKTFHWTLFLMPAAGLLIVWLYQIAGEGKNRGTDLIIDAVDGKAEISPAVGPLIFAATVLSHSVSGSIGREGAALQLGGCMGSVIGKIIPLTKEERQTAIMCGMSACFSALFGTPLTAAIFPIEMVCVGTMKLGAIAPCMAASFLAVGIAGKLGLAPEAYEIGSFAEFSISGAGLAVLIAILGSLMAIFMCWWLHKSGHLYKQYLPNPYVRVVVGSLIYIVLTLIFSSRLYNGSGAAIIEHCFEGEKVPMYAFLVKLLFTSVALGCGFKGGEIVPALSIGAALGAAIAAVLGMPVGLCSAIGMMCLFAGVTNCPISTLFMAFELFGFEAMPYFAIAVAVAYTFSGYASLYHVQKFRYEKLSLGDKDL